jgi:uncharacterized membrane protein YuzA (DUF378 family)
MKFKRNMHRLDQLVRIVLGVVLIYVGFINTGLINSDVINWILGLFGIVNIVVAIASYCPVYSLADISTCKDPKE